MKLNGRRTDEVKSQNRKVHISINLQFCGPLTRGEHSSSNTILEVNNDFIELCARGWDMQILSDPNKT